MTMNKCLLIFAIAVANCLADVPFFSWDTERSSNNGVPLLNVLFPDGQKDVIHLKRTEFSFKLADDGLCLFEGFLQDEPTSYVALSGGCAFSDTFNVQFQSSRASGFNYRVEQGHVERVGSVFNEGASLVGARLEDQLLIRDKAVTVPGFDNERKRNQTLSRIAFPVNGFKITVKIFYDQLFKSRFGADSAAETLAVMQLVKGYYQLPTLTTKIFFNIPTAPQEILDELTEGATVNTLNNVKPLVTDTSFNANIFFTFANNAAGVVGIAWLGTVCRPASGSDVKTSINEWFVSTAKTAEIVAHELGHNLNMRHDFLGSDADIPRFDSLGNSCKNNGGVMDYFQPEVTGWSTCSVEDFQNLYDANQPFCIPEAAPDAETTTTTTTSTTTTTTTTQSTTTTTTASTTTTTTTTQSTTTTTTTSTTTTTTTTQSTSTTTTSSTTSTTSSTTMTTTATSTTTKTTTKTTTPTTSKTTTFNVVVSECLTYGAACSKVCATKNYSTNYACLVFTPRRRICNCGIYAPTTGATVSTVQTTTKTTSTVKPPTTTTTTLDAYCRTVTSCVAICGRVNFSATYVCRVTSPRAVYCNCGLYRPQG